MKAGDLFDNPVTGEHGYIRKGTAETGGALLIADLRVRPGGGVAGEHYHPTITERFTVVYGQIEYKLDGRRGMVKAGQTLDLPPGVPHDWWNAGPEEARVIVQVTPATRFEQMILTLFELAKQGKTTRKLARLLGYKALYHRTETGTVAVEPLPEGLVIDEIDIHHKNNER